MNFYDNLNAKNVFHFFEEISKIPRGSFNEKGISNYLLILRTSKRAYEPWKFNFKIIRDGSFWPLSYVLLYP